MAFTQYKALFWPVHSNQSPLRCQAGGNFCLDGRKDGMTGTTEQG